MLTAELDDIVSRLERAWGVDRLPKLVSPETAAKFDKAVAMRAERGESMNAMMARAWAALGAEARQRGHEPLGAGMEHEWAPGRLFAVAQDAQHARALNMRNKAEGRTVSVWTLQELAELIASVPIAAEVKDAFPGAVVTKRAKPRPLPEDEIPFGQEDAA